MKSISTIAIAALFIASTSLADTTKEDPAKSNSTHSEALQLAAEFVVYGVLGFAFHELVALISSNAQRTK